MVCTTFLSDEEQNIPLENKELQSYLDEIRAATGRNWQLIAQKHTVKGGIFRKPETFTTYTLYLEVGGVGPFQQMTCVSSEREAYAYFFGPLSGLSK